MGEFTPKYKLYKPAIGEVNWGDDMNANLDKLEQILDTIEAKARSKLAELDDVDLTGVQDGHVLTYNASQGKWLPKSVGGGFSKIGEVKAESDCAYIELADLNIETTKPLMVIGAIANNSGSSSSYGIIVKGTPLWANVIRDGSLYSNVSRCIYDVPNGCYVIFHAILFVMFGGRLFGNGQYAVYDPSNDTRIMGVFGGCGCCLSSPITKLRIDSDWSNGIGAGSVVKWYVLE